METIKILKVCTKIFKICRKLAVKSSDFLVSDSLGIQDYLKKTYNKSSIYIAYGAKLFKNPNQEVLNFYNLKPYQYNMLIARLEPENNIEIILDGVVKANQKKPFVVIGKHNANKFGKYLKEKFKKHENIIFLGGIYDIDHLDNLRYYSNLYFHGHSVGGTNPSLLEAMSSKALIVAHDNQFNKSILKDNAFYFTTDTDVKNIIVSIKDKGENNKKINNAYKDIAEYYNWDIINKKYLMFFNKCLRQHE